MMPLHAPRLRMCDHFFCQLGVVQNQGELWGTLLSRWPPVSTWHLLCGQRYGLSSLQAQQARAPQNILLPLGLLALNPHWASFVFEQSNRLHLMTLNLQPIILQCWWAPSRSKGIHTITQSDALCALVALLRFTGVVTDISCPHSVLAIPFSVRVVCVAHIAA